jgi:hypothetical protein
MALTALQKNALKSPQKLGAQDRATANYKLREKLERELNDLDAIESMLSFLPREHAKNAVKDKHIIKAMNILLALLDLREIKRVRQNSPGEEGYVIKVHRGRYQRAPLTQKDYNRYVAMSYFARQFRNYFNPKVALPGEPGFMDIPPNPVAWLSIDDDIDYQIHLQQLHGDSDKPKYEMSKLDKKRIKEIEKRLFDPAIDQETRERLIKESIHLSNKAVLDADMPYVESDEGLEELSQKAIQRNIDAINKRIEFFRSTH